MKQTTLVYLIDGNKVLLARKQRGVGAGKWNGPGGKVEPGESIEEAARRECQEEVGVAPVELEKMADLGFTMDSIALDNQVIVYVSRKWEGEPLATVEMIPQWFPIDQLPYDELWGSDRLWLPRVLSGEKLVGKFILGEKEEALDYELQTVDRLD